MPARRSRKARSSTRPRKGLRHLVLVLGDQLDRRATVLRELDPARDAVWMAEVAQEATHVWCHQLRIAAFFAAMRHFRDELEADDLPVHYHALGPDPAKDAGADFGELLARDLERLRPQALRVTWPGDWRVLELLRRTARKADVPLELCEDRHFYASLEDFDAWAEGRKQLVLEGWYRTLRRRHDVLMQADGEPVGGRWNFDEANRASFGREGPGKLPAVKGFAPDATTLEVIDLVRERFADHPGSLEHFDLPVRRRDARALLRDFVRHRLPRFGTHQDAIWEGESFLFHSRLSFALNVKLLDPRECVAAAVAAHEAGDAPLNAVEGFVRQILGWREFVRGVYWRLMPDYAGRNELGCEERDVPSFFWDGETDMACVRDAMRSVIDHGYAHHIQRLMVLGLFAQLLGVHPLRFHEWHMAMYLDAIDWVSLPNTLGMSQYGDGGVVGTKPYCATGAYIDRMSNHCKGCRYQPKRAHGEDACPFTTLYWDFLARHRKRFAGNPRMGFQMKNLERKPAAELTRIHSAARKLRAAIDADPRSGAA